jgi:TP901 family phage tail tape measure protein
MAVVTRVEALITAQNGLKPGLAAAARDLERFRQLQARATSAMRGQEIADRVGGALRTGLGALGIAGIGAASAQAVRQFAQVERGMTRVGITGEATRERVAGATTELKTLAYQTAMPFEQMRAGLDALTASGLEFEQSMQTLPSVVKTAQASGAAVADIANSSQAMMEHFKISVEQLGEAQDILAKGGKLGKFETKDMARYLPSLLPTAKAYGLSGIEGIKKFTAYAQTIRAGTGSAEEAAAAMADIFAKMDMEGTVKNFKDMGVDLPKHLAKARKEGKELLGVLVNVTRAATKGDLSLINQLFPDRQASRGMLAILSNPGKYEGFLKELNGAAGTVNADFQRVLKDKQADLDRLATSFERITVATGGFMAHLANAGGLTDKMQEAAARLEKATEESQQRGLLRTIANVPQRSDSVISDFWSQLLEDIKGVGPRQIEGLDTIGLGKLQSEIAAQRKLIADLEKSNGGSQFPPNSAAARLAGGTNGRALAQARAALAEKEGRLAGLQAGFPWQDGYQPLDHMAIMGQMPADAYEEHSRRRGTLTPVQHGKRVNIPLPVPRPTNGSEGLPLTQGLDDAVPKAAAVVSEVSKIGPAGQQAAAQVAAGADLFRSRWFGAISDVEQRLSGMRVPGGFGAGGGFNTGKSMREIE